LNVSRPWKERREKMVSLAGRSTTATKCSILPHLMTSGLEHTAKVYPTTRKSPGTEGAAEGFVGLPPVLAPV
jgi:hypothetical protein